MKPYIPASYSSLTNKFVFAF